MNFNSNSNRGPLYEGRKEKQFQSQIITGKKSKVEKKEKKP